MPFIPGQLYNRRTDIHSIYGGNWQSGICPSSKFPFIFIFTGQTGTQHGYKDGWDNADVFSYTGEGQLGDMQFTRGNLALRDHIQNGKRVFLFESVSTGIVRFVSEVEVFDIDYFETHDTTGKSRIGIKFSFKRKGAYLPFQPMELNENAIAADRIADYNIQLPFKTERETTITTRIGQSLYRKRVIYKWDYKCAVTGFDKLDLLRASHIVPWSESNDEERIDPHNGLLLSPTYDALFDNHYISFENSGKIILSDQIALSAFQKINVTGKEQIKNLHSDHHQYLERHRDRFNETH